MEVALYARHSSDKQITSSQDQIARCKAWCLKKGYQIKDIFIDEAISGAAIQNRPGFRDLIKASLDGRFARVICEDLSRISRDQEDVAAFFKKMIFLDIPIETITEGEINELHIGLKGTMNALYLKDLADKTKRGMKAAVLSGSVPGGRTYGYDLVHEIRNGQPIPGLRKVNKVEADIVRQIFNDYVGGKTLQQICEHLNLLAIPSPKDKKWHQTTLTGTVDRNTGILRQSLYKGIVTYNKIAYKKHPETGKRLAVPRPKEEWIRTPMPDLAILTEALFDTAQEQLQKRATGRTKRKAVIAIMTAAEKRIEAVNKVRTLRCNQTRQRRYPLQLISRKLHCADHNLSIRSIRSGLYNCPDKSCKNRNLRRQDLVDLTHRSLRTFSAADLKRFIADKKAQKNELLSCRDKLSDKLEQKRTEIKTILDHFSTQKAGSETLRFLNNKEKECQRLVYDIQQYQKEIDKCSDISLHRCTEIISGLQALVTQNEQQPDNDDVLELLNKLITRISISSEFDGKMQAFVTKAKVSLDVEMLIGTFS